MQVSCSAVRPAELWSAAAASTRHRFGRPRASEPPSLPRGCPSIPPHHLDLHEVGAAPVFSPLPFFGPPVPDSSSVLSRLPRRAHINTTARHFVSLRFWSFLFLPSPLSPERSLPGSPVLAFGTPLLCLRQQAIVLKCRSPLRKGIVTFFPKSRPLTTSLSGCLDAPADTPGAGSEKTYQLTMASYQHFSVIEYRNHVSQGWPQVLCRGLGAPSPADEHAGREGGHLRTISHGAFLALRPSTPNRMQLSSRGLSPSQHRRTRVQDAANTSPFPPDEAP